MLLFSGRRKVVLKFTDVSVLWRTMSRFKTSPTYAFNRHTISKFLMGILKIHKFESNLSFVSGYKE